MNSRLDALVLLAPTIIVWMTYFCIDIWVDLVGRNRNTSPMGRISDWLEEPFDDLNTMFWLFVPLFFVPSLIMALDVALAINALKLTLSLGLAKASAMAIVFHILLRIWQWRKRPKTA